MNSLTSKGSRKSRFFALTRPWLPYKEESGKLRKNDNPMILYHLIFLAHLPKFTCIVLILTMKKIENNPAYIRHLTQV